MHLPRVGVCEAPQPEIDEHEAAWSAVEEDEIDAEPVVANPQAALSTNEAEVAPQFEQESLEMADERLFEIALGVLVSESEELEHERILDLLLRRHSVAWPKARTALEHRGLVLRQHRPFIELALDLAIELAYGPAAAMRLIRVEAPSVRIRDGEQADVGRPREGESASRLALRASLQISSGRLRTTVGLRG